MMDAGQSAWRALRLSARRVSPAQLAALGGWLVLAPHQDDETLGAGSLIAALAEERRPAWVAFLTDGSASHVGAPDWPPSRIARTRAREARRALNALGAASHRILDLGWPDSRPFAKGSPAFDRAGKRVAALCRRENIRAIATTWRHDPHCDHRAAFAIARAAERRSHGRIRVFEYPVWGWTDPELRARTRDQARLALDARKPARLARRAILHHRSQTSPLIANAEAAFRLPREMAGIAGRNPAILFHERQRHAT